MLEPNVTEASEGTGGNSPEWLARRLAELAPGMTARQREAVIGHLRAAELVAGTPEFPAAAATAGTGNSAGDLGGAPGHATEAMKNTLGLAAHEHPDPAQLTRTFVFLVKQMLDIEQLAWTTWKAIDGANSPVRRQVELKTPLRQSILPDAEGKGANLPAELQAAVDGVRNILRGVIGSVPQIPEIAQKYFSALSPANLQMKLELEGRLGAFNREKKCWQEYVEQYDRIVNEQALLAGILKKIAEQTRKAAMGG